MGSDHSMQLTLKLCINQQFLRFLELETAVTTVTTVNTWIHPMQLTPGMLSADFCEKPDLIRQWSKDAANRMLGQMTPPQARQNTLKWHSPAGQAILTSQYRQVLNHGYIICTAMH